MARSPVPPPRYQNPACVTRAASRPLVSTGSRARTYGERGRHPTPPGGGENGRGEKENRRNLPAVLCLGLHLGGRRPGGLRRPNRGNGFPIDGKATLRQA